MNLINLPASSSVHLTKEETQLLDLWHACGLSLVLENAQQIEPILLYLQYGAEHQDGFAYNLSYPYYAVMERAFWQSAARSLQRSDAYSFMWIYRYSSYETSLKLLRAKLIGGYDEPDYIPSGYNSNHPSFAVNEAKWAKYCTLLALEGFPTRLSYRLYRAIDWLSSYEALQDRFEEDPLLLKMRKSLLRLGNRGHHDLIAGWGDKSLQLPPQTAGVRKYMSTKGLDRLAMMRQYTHDSQTSY